MKTTKSRNSGQIPVATIKKVFGERLTELRLARGLTVEQFAVVFSAKTTTVRGWLNALVLPRTEALIQIANSFGVTIDWLLGVPGAPKSPTKWRTMETFEHDLALATVCSVRLRGGVAAALVDEFEVDGQAALEWLTDQVEDAVHRSAEQRARWVVQRDALEAATAQSHDIARRVAALKSSAVPASNGPAKTRVRSKDQNADQTSQELPAYLMTINKTIAPALIALQNAMADHENSVRTKSLGGRELVKMATSVALEAGIARDGVDVDLQLLSEDLASSRRIADKHWRATHQR